MAAPRVVLVQYQVTEERTIAFVGRGDLLEPRVVRIPLSQTQLRAVVGETFGALQVSAFRSVPAESWVRTLSPLVDFLGEWSDPDDIIWFVPHDALHHVPLHALEVEGQPLVERNASVYSPSASVMRYARRMHRPGRARAVILADSRADRPLLHARDQATQVSRLYEPDARLALGSTANITWLTEEVAAAPDGFAVLHVACHGDFNQSDPERSGLWLASDEGHDGLLRAADLSTMSLRANLVMLSACESGLTGRLPGNELLGLTRALLYAGAAAAVVTLWSVDELSTSVVTGAFYERFHAGMGAAVSLREAQRVLRRTTLADLADYCKASPTESNDHRALRDLDLAAIHFAAGAFDLAVRQYRLIAETQPSGSRWHRAAVRGEANVRLVSASPGPTADYSIRPYEHPYFWAPFYLSGDWR